MYVLCNFVLGYDAFHSDVQVTKTDVQYMHKTDTGSWKLKQKATKPLAMFHQSNPLEHQTQYSQGSGHLK